MPVESVLQLARQRVALHALVLPLLERSLLLFDTLSTMDQVQSLLTGI